MKRPLTHPIARATSDWLGGLLAGRPWWMNAMMVFSAYMAFVYVPWDLLVKPVARDEEVWFGLVLTGYGAKLTEPIHWAIYAAGAYGFYHMRAWMWPWAAVYVAQVAIAMLVWNLLYGAPGLLGVIAGLVSAAPFALLVRALVRERERFGAAPAALGERYGEWGLVTGASSGIGAAFARALARQGVSCVLTARRRERLEALAAELEAAHGVATRVIAEDLEEPAAAARLAAAVSELPVSILVNNAGFGSAGRFDRQDPERLRALVQVSCAAPLELTHRLLPGMRSRGRGAVLFSGSIAGRQALPLHAAYAAGKAFELLLGESLRVELRDAGVDVLVVEPGSTATEFQEGSGEIRHAGVSPERVVEVALAALGRQPSVIVGWADWIRVNLATRLLPRALVAYLAREVMSQRTPPERR